MKLFFIGVLFFTFTLVAGQPPCNGLKFEVKVTHTTDNLDNGKIEVTIIKSAAGVKAFLYGDKKSKNRLDVKPDQLTQLAAGTYQLVLQDNNCSTLKRDIIIK
jgi:hypothetical protein